MRKATVTRKTIDSAAELVRRSHPRGLKVGELAVLLSVNPATLRTGGYLDEITALHQDIYRDKREGRLYNDPEKTVVFLSLKAAIANGETEWATELRVRWDALHTAPRGQTTLDVEEEP